MEVASLYATQSNEYCQLGPSPMTRTQMLDHAVVSVARKTASKFIDMSEKTQLRFWAHHPSDIPHALIAAEFGKIQRTRAFL